MPRVAKFKRTEENMMKFMKLWNTTDTIAEVAIHFNIPKKKAQYTAYNLRSNGVFLKRKSPPKINLSEVVKLSKTYQQKRLARK